MNPSSSALPYRGVFINLARSAARRATLTQHLQEIGLAALYQRLDAVDGRAAPQREQTQLPPGALGAWLSGEKLLREHSGSDLHLHFIEDDVLLGKESANHFDAILRQADARVPNWDLIFTDVFVPPTMELFKLYAEKIADYKRQGIITLLDMTSVLFAAASSVFINKASIAKFLAVVEGKWTLGLPFDLYVRQFIHQGHLKAFLTLPFLTSLSRHSNQSDIRGELDCSRKVTDLMRGGYFIDADHAALLAEMQELTKDANVPPLTRLFLDTLSFSMSDKWVPF